VKLSPALFPVRRDLLRANLAEGGPEALLAPGVGIRHQFDRIRVLELLEASREELDHLGTRRLGSFGRH
jgi:hypothetical protein